MLHVRDVDNESPRRQAVHGGAGVSRREGEVVDIHIEEPHITNPNDGIAGIEGYVIDVEGGRRHVGRAAQGGDTRVFRTYARASWSRIDSGPSGVLEFRG